MSKKEKEILEAIISAVQNMSEHDKDYLLGISEAMAAERKDAAEGKSLNQEMGEYLEENSDEESMIVTQRMRKVYIETTVESMNEIPWASDLKLICLLAMRLND